MYTVKISGQEVWIDCHNRRLVHANNSITSDYLHMLYRKKILHRGKKCYMKSNRKKKTTQK